MLPLWVFRSLAYRSLRPVARTLLWELIYRHNGYNNGRIGLSIREAAQACNVNKDTLAKYYRELQDYGFLKATKRGGFNMKDPAASRATEWRLTWIDADGVKATKEFKNWEPAAAAEEKHGPHFTAMQSQFP